MLLIGSIIAISATLIFGIIAIVYLMREEKAIKQLVDNELKQKQRLFEITMMKEIQDRIGYSLEIEKVVDVILGSLDALLHYSTVSALVIEKERPQFKTHIKEAVSQQYIDNLKTSLLKSYVTIESTEVPTVAEGNVSGVALDDLNHATPGSSFHVPLIVNDRVVSMINVSAIKANTFSEAEMTTLYKIAAQASAALSRLENILTVEKGKLMAMIGSLADGLFMVDLKGQLTIINNAAKDFLGIPKDNPS